MFYTYLIFFFSSRRRHTRCSRDWSSDVCSSDLYMHDGAFPTLEAVLKHYNDVPRALREYDTQQLPPALQQMRSEEHTSELSHGYISYAVFCLKKKKKVKHTVTKQSKTLLH